MVRRLLAEHERSSNKMNSQVPDILSNQSGDSSLDDSDLNLHRIQSNRKMLDLRQQVQWQNKIIRQLKIERDRLTKELASRLYFVEAQLLREQKHIENLLSEKDQYIRFQGIQIESLKSILSQVDQDYRNPQHQQRGRRRSKQQQPPLSKRYSVALDEYMKDYGVVSRALPVVVQDAKISSPRRTRTLSLPELNIPEGWEYDPYYIPDPPPEENVIDELAARRWTSDCDSEHSDSLDSGISSPSIKSRNMHVEDVVPLPCASEDEGVVRLEQPATTTPRRRSSSIGSFLNRTFSSSSSSSLDKQQESVTRRHGSFSEVEATTQKKIEPTPQKPRFISSANRTFGTNHRSVTKPRDIKFRKLFKFRRRAEPDEQSNVQCEDYMTV